VLADPVGEITLSRDLVLSAPGGVEQDSPRVGGRDGTPGGSSGCEPAGLAADD
jgi:hypothetical protein